MRQTKKPGINAPFTKSLVFGAHHVPVSGAKVGRQEAIQAPQVLLLHIFLLASVRHIV
jgi:hypothetical protein